MSLDVWLEDYVPAEAYTPNPETGEMERVKIWNKEEVFSYNITHNLGKMAREAGVYTALWRPEEENLNKAKDLVPFLEAGLAELKRDPAYYRQFNPENGWGCFEDLCSCVVLYLEACQKYSNANIRTCR